MRNTKDILHLLSEARAGIDEVLGDAFFEDMTAVERETINKSLNNIIEVEKYLTRNSIEVSDIKHTSNVLKTMLADENQFFVNALGNDRWKIYASRRNLEKLAQGM